MSNFIKKVFLIPAWVTEYFKPCTSFKDQIPDDDIFLIIAHRGSPEKEVENTIRSFERAIDEGANAIELDLCVTLDNQVVIWHDWNPNSTVALLRESGFEPIVKYRPAVPSIGNDLRRQICELNLKEFLSNYNYKLRDDGDVKVDAEIPTLEQFFKWGSKNKKIINVHFDIKVPKDCYEKAFIILEDIKKYVNQYKPVFNVIIESFDEFVFREMKNKYPEFSYILDIEPSYGIILDPNDYSAVRAAIKYKTEYSLAFLPRQITIANWVTHRRIIRNDVKLRMEYNKKNSDKPLKRLISGTINKKRHIKCLIRQGVGGIVTDKPALVHKYAVKLGRKIK